MVSPIETRLNHFDQMPSPFQMKSYIKLPPDYLPSSGSFGSFGSSESTTSKSSVSSRPIYQSLRLFSEQIGTFILFKLLCCFFISLANFAFNEKFAKLIASTLENDPRNRIACETYQSYLLVLEIGCWILPLAVYLLWAKVSASK